MIAVARAEATAGAALGAAAGDGSPFPPVARPSVERLEGSLIRDVAQSAWDVEGLIPLWFGEPDLPTPPAAVEAAIGSLRAGETLYSSNFGIAPLREAIAEYARGLGRRVTAGRVCVTSSGLNAVMLAAQAILSPGDRVVVLTPHWPNLAAIPQVLGAEIVLVPLSASGGRWRLDLDRLLQALTPEVRMLILNSPSNPTGWTMPAAGMREVLAHCRRLGIWILADEVYERMVFEGQAAPSFLEVAEPDDRLVAVNSFSKAWSMTGWRLGWLTAPEALMPALGRLSEFNTSCAPVFVQRGAIAALSGAGDFVRAATDRLRGLRDLATTRLGAIPGVSVPEPDGAMYAFFAVEGCDDSVALARRLAREARVGLAPGRAFGAAGEGRLRLCFAVAEPTLAEACDRLAAALPALARS
ncbi:pyridoxal phosphate-dependent aminotransferase [Rhizosaccharibacter radicis]|uniref:Aminotransferase n=1 Tax=Rhizosaccharibacter radicis TaxID=2782605 RepID=A0ABT1VSY2_9PROT|nr:pyridoxal phosphate-dependent aminotransferase [Acetobacteraceae bacterium KSS12]